MNYTNSHIPAWLLRIQAMLILAILSVSASYAVEQPVFAPGECEFYNPVTVSITAPAGTSVKYTVDGKRPTASYGTAYTNPLTFTKTTTLRAVAIDANGEVSEVTTATYTCTRHAMGEDFNPEDPGNPEADGTTHIMTLIGDPVSNFNYGTTTRIKTGETVTVESYGILGYDFVGFYLDNKKVSSDPTYTFEMPNRNITLIGQYEFNPVNPDDPEAMPLSRMVSLKTVPENAGSYNLESKRYLEGDTLNIWVWDMGGFRFDYFTVDGVKTDCVNDVDHNIIVPVGGKNIDIVAHFHFDPLSPIDPNLNYWDPETGEMIIDCFETDRLWETINQKLDQYGSSWEMITRVMIKGVMNNNDFGAIRSMPNVTIVDLSRVEGLTYLPAWAFENCSVSTLLLPASVENVEPYPFWDCQNLTSISIYAPMPPEAYEIFGGWEYGPNSCVLHVPEASIPLYKETFPWSEFAFIEPIIDNIRSLTVVMPKDSEGMYKNFRLELTNIKTASRQRYTMSSRTEYTFAGLLDDETYRLKLYTPAGFEIASIPSIYVDPAETTTEIVKAFDSITPVYDLAVTLTKPDGTDVTKEATIEWYNLNPITKEYEFMLREPVLPNIPEGMVMQYRITLNDALGREYLIVPDAEVTASEDTKDVNIELTPLRTIILKGNVVDNDGKILAGATVAVSQDVNGIYSKTYTTTTDAKGAWTLTVVEAPNTRITYSAPEHVNATGEVTAEQLAADEVTLPQAVLKLIEGGRISYTLTYIEAVEKGENPTTQTFNDYMNVNVAIYNVTQDREQNLLSVQEKEIVILEENVNAGDVLKITISSKNDKFAEMTQNVTVSTALKATARFNIKAPGGIKTTLATDATDGKAVAMLYNGNGQLVTKADYKDFEAMFSNLDDDTYTLVTMAKTNRLNTVARLVALEETGLKPGKDYLANEVKVEKGVIAVVEIAKVPELDESIFNHTGDLTSFTINKASLTTGNYATLNAFVDFKEAYKDDISDVKFIFDLPEGCEMVKGSGMLGTALVPYDYDDNTVIFSIGDLYNNHLKFCIMPTSGGVKNISAYVSFDYNNETYREPFGNVSCKVKDLSITVPSIIVKPQLPVSGIAKGGATIDVNEGTQLIGQTHAIASGSWTANCEIIDQTEGTEHYISANITNKDGKVLTTETKVTKYDPSLSVPTMTEMHFFNGWLRQNITVHFDFANAYIWEYSYMFYTTTNFSFITKFTDPTMVKNVVVHVKTTSNEVRHLPALYNEAKKLWVSTSEFSSESLPTNISITYDIIDYDDHILYDDDEGEYFPVPTNPILDPSGYVYEGDEDNRLEGVQASIYFQEELEDIWGDPYTEITLWNAEEYGQKNPLFTDALGMYQWDVVDGLWQVKFEKAGYETTYSEWLPVPPPQLDVNIGMLRIGAPQVDDIHAYAAGIDIKFDQPMLPETLIADNFKVSVDGAFVNGDITYSLEPGCNYVQSCRFVPEEEFEAEKVYLIVSRHVASHAGVEMNADKVQEVYVELEVKAIDAPETAQVGYGASSTINIKVTPANAAKGRTLNVATSSDQIVSIESDQVVIDNNGNATVTISGELPATAQLSYNIDDVDIKASTNVSVVAKLTEIVPQDDIDLIINKSIKANVYALPGNVAKGQIVKITVSDASGLGLSCGNSLELDEDGQGIFTITALEAGEYTITYEMTDEDNNKLTATSTVTVSDVMPGDANSDGEITVVDISILVQYLLGKNPANIVLAGADANCDGSVDIVDITTIVRMILSNNSSKAPTRNGLPALTMAQFEMTDIDLNDSGYGVAAISMSKAMDAVGTQFDIIVPDGLKLVDLQLANDNGKQSMAYRHIDDNTVRVIAYTNGKCNFSDNTLFNAIFTADGVIRNTETIQIVNGLVDTIEGNSVKEHSVRGTSAVVNIVTGIEDAVSTSECEIKAEGHTLIITAPADTRLVMSNALGQYRILDVKAGVNRFHISEGGVLLINKQKVIIK